MSWDQIAGLALTLLVMFIGLIGSVVPAIPSTPVVLIAAIGHRLYFQEQSASNWVMGALVVITLVSLVLDFLASMFGAKKLGATWRGVTGAVVGAIVGLFFNLPGILFGPFIGAMLFEMAGDREWKEAAKAGVGATLGVVLGAVAKLGCCVAMMALFAISVFANSGIETPVVPPGTLEAPANGAAATGVW